MILYIICYMTCFRYIPQGLEWSDKDLWVVNYMINPAKAALTCETSHKYGYLLVINLVPLIYMIGELPNIVWVVCTQGKGLLDITYVINAPKLILKQKMIALMIRF